MKLRALKEFNHGSLTQHYLPGEVFFISDGDGADLVKAGLAEPATTEADDRETKPEPAAAALAYKAAAPDTPVLTATVLTRKSD